MFFHEVPLYPLQSLIGFFQSQELLHIALCGRLVQGVNTWVQMCCCRPGQPSSFERLVKSENCEGAASCVMFSSGNPGMKKEKSTIAEGIASLALTSRLDNIGAAIVERLKLHLLDSIGCAFGALDAIPVRRLRDQIEEFGGKPICTLI